MGHGHWHPSWSPDGRHIVFIAGRNFESKDVFIMDADGRNVRAVRPHVAHEGHPAWSPDGSRIAFVSNRTGSLDIFTTDIRGKKLRNLTQDVGQNHYPAWSPDGDSIVFSSRRGDGQLHLYAMASDGSDVRLLFDRARYQSSPVWSPDGRHIAFVHVPPPTGDLYILDTHTGEATQVTDHPRIDSNPDWFDPRYARVVSPARKWSVTWAWLKGGFTAP
jgi:TolB protein